MSSYPRLMPAEPRMFTAQVVRTERISPSFQRVTIASAELAEFDWRGLDHWFRLFFPLAPDAGFRLPAVEGRLWWKSYLAIPDEQRPHCSNYTVAGYRRLGDHAELDIDVVLHWHDDRLTGVAAWSVAARPGGPVAILDQGVLFDPPRDTTGYLLVADESGLPAIRGILRDLPPDAVGTAIIEVPASGDVTGVQAPDGVTVHWVPRDETGELVGARALRALEEVATPAASSYAFVVGESSLATQGRRTLHQAGLPKERITFSGFWKA
ncbi:MAG: siderophore-interacting protein [Micropruina sp.]|uniref:siderophore-interacting protein n=1 Tax=Micropruina sp. TaxID=2737536 RepID=UPI0039E6EEE2